MRTKLLFVSLSLAATMTSQIMGMTSPVAQAESPVWLEVKVQKVTTTPGEGEGIQNVNATVEVLQAFKGPEGLKSGDTIQIVYTHDPKPLYGPDGKRPIGPSSPPLLREGRTTYAFLTPGEAEGTYAPGAVAWSFAPPFGIPKESRDELGMKAPTPPSAPPPPPPNFQVPMKGPTPPTMKAPGTPPPPPATEQQIETGTPAAK